MIANLPRGWSWVSLGSLATSVRNGLFVSRPAAEPPGHRIFRISAVRPGRLDLSDVRFAQDPPRGFETYFVGQGDLLVTRYSGNRTYVGSAAVVPTLDEPTLHPDKLIRVCLDGAVADPRFVAYALNTVSRPAIEARLKTTAGQVGIAGRQLAQVPIPLAPLPEQRRVVDAVEEQFSRLDHAVALIQSARARLTLMRRVVLDRVMPEPLPDDWRLLTVEEAGTVELGRQRSPKYHSGPNMKPYLRVANVHEDCIDLSDVKEMDFPPDQLQRYELQPGDILLNEGNGSPELVGSPAMYRGELPGACFTNSLIRFRPFSFVDGDYALLLFLRHLRTGRFQSAAQITTIAHMAAGRFKRVEFPLPPIEEQRDIVLDVRRDLSLLSAVATTLEGALHWANSLRAAILAAAFRGELVPQDASAELAGDFVARIAANRSAGGPVPAANGA